MRKLRTFLAITEDAERLSLISTTLHRKFPNSAVLTCRDSKPALAIARAQSLDAVVANASSDLDELLLVDQLRAATTVPILLMSSRHTEEAALAAGATCFLSAQRWLLVGTVVAAMLGRAD